MINSSVEKAYGIRDGKNVVLVRKVKLNNLTEICGSVSYEVSNYGISRIIPAYFALECNCDSCLYASNIMLLLRKEVSDGKLQ